MATGTDFYEFELEKGASLEFKTRTRKEAFNHFCTRKFSFILKKEEMKTSRYRNDPLPYRNTSDDVMLTDLS